jgi:hypothetical protein
VVPASEQNLEPEMQQIEILWHKKTKSKQEPQQLGNRDEISSSGKKSKRGSELLSTEARGRPSAGLTARSRRTPAGRISGAGIFLPARRRKTEREKAVLAQRPRRAGKASGASGDRRTRQQDNRGRTEELDGTAAGERSERKHKSDETPMHSDSREEQARGNEKSSVPKPKSTQKKTRAATGNLN